SIWRRRRSIHDWRAHVFRQLAGKRIDSGARSRSRRAHVFARQVLDLRDWKMVLLGKSQLHIPDCSESLLHYARHALAPFASKSDWPAYGEALADMAFPFGTDGSKISGEDVRGAAAVGTMHHDDAPVGKIDFGIVLLDGSILPILDRAEINTRECLWAQLQGLFELFQV